MTELNLFLKPLLPTSVLVVLAIAALAMLGFGLWRRAKGIWFRAGLLGFLFLILLQPVLREEQVTPLDDIVLVIDDHSPSQALDDRRRRADDASDRMLRAFEEFNNLEVVTKEIRGDSAGTRIGPVIDDALIDIDRNRLAGVIVLTDGQIHDLRDNPVGPIINAPVHGLITGRRDEIDRKLVIEQAPTFAMIGEEQRLVVRVEEFGLDQPSAQIPIEVRQNGEPILISSITPGVDQPVSFTLKQAGRSLIEVEAGLLEGELTPINNRSTVTINGIRDRLRVLLVSGRPYPGLRVWRNLLKADPAVDLVHFTILRPPEKQDGTPIRELALIAFPSHELFEEKIDEFDLVIFDRYSRRGLLPLVYLDNVARYVENGGALLEAAGPEFAGDLSLFQTPLARVLPGQPSGEVFRRPFKPTISELGRRHPVTRNLMNAVENGSEEPSWGSWFRQVDVEVPDGQVVMTGIADRPLLALSRVGEGRVAQLLSDHHWLWARGVEGGGPQGLLLRRLVHWLMKEPELEEEQLKMRGEDGALVIERQSLDSTDVEASITSPSGETQQLTLSPNAQGIAEFRFDADEDGVYRLDDGDHVAYAMPSALARAELADLRATESLIQPWTAQSGGSIRWLADDGIPDIRRVSIGRSVEGRGWIGLVRNERYVVDGLRQINLFPAWLALLAVLSLTALSWWREGRG